MACRGGTSMLNCFYPLILLLDIFYRSKVDLLRRRLLHSLNYPLLDSAKEEIICSEV